MKWWACAALVLLSLGCRRQGGTDAGPSAEWLAGAGPAASRVARSDGGTLVVRVGNEPNGLNTLDDAFRDGLTLRVTQRLVVESLVELDGPKLMPGLASSWEVNDGGDRWVFHLDERARFHDGSPVDAQAVLAVLEAVFTQNNPTALARASLGSLEGWQALDAQTVELRYRETPGVDVRRLAGLPITKGPFHWGERTEQLVGSGPFRVERWERGQRLTLARTAWWRGQVPLERIVFRFVKDITVAANLFERRELDVLTGVTPALWRSLEGPQGAWAHQTTRRYRGLDNAFSYIGWRVDSPGLDDIRLRRAMAHLYPRAAVTDLVDLRLEEPTQCPFYSKGRQCSDGGVTPELDVAAATELLAAAGWADTDDDGWLDRDGGMLEVKVLVPASSVRLAKLLPMYAEQAKAAGVKLVAEPVDQATMTSRVAARDFMAVSRLWTELDEEQDLWPLFHSSEADGGTNFTGLRDAKVDKYLEALRRTADPETRVGLSQALHRRLVGLQPVLILSARQSLDLAQRRVHGLRPSVHWFDLRQVWVDEEH